MEIVKFKNGKYAIRRNHRNGEHLYKDLTGDFWWVKGSRFLVDCLGDYSKVKKAYDYMLDFGEVVDHQKEEIKQQTKKSLRETLRGFLSSLKRSSLKRKG